MNLVAWLVVAQSAIPGTSPDAGCQQAARLVREARSVGETAGPDRALTMYAEATRLCPTSWEAQNNLGDTYERLGRLDQARAAYLEASRLNPESPYPFFGLGDVYRKLGDRDLALVWYRRGLQLEPVRGDTAAFEETRAFVRTLTADDPGGLVPAETIARGLDPGGLTARGVGVVEALAFDERLIPFGLNSTNLLPAARAQLREISMALFDILRRSKATPQGGAQVVALVAGHADVRGSPMYNRQLALRRAESVVDELVVRFGAPRSALKAVSYGSERPLCRDQSESCHARNRRVELLRP
jgi:outer membrane protein OmpA-like peptidoglycan-associated protein